MQLQFGGHVRNRTGLKGFADPRLTIRPRGPRNKVKTNINYRYIQLKKTIKLTQYKIL